MTISLDEIYFVYSPGLGQESRKKLRKYAYMNIMLKKFSGLKQGALFLHTADPGLLELAGY